MVFPSKDACAGDKHAVLPERSKPSLETTIFCCISHSDIKNFVEGGCGD